ncbi:MAG TPA: sulfate ABC transporter substrate-binding protein [Chthoniobacterales bacterium]|nr:sulfate ABC transporter substrate-binding protein [Chthoniobacterales bacterium]
MKRTWTTVLPLLAVFAAVALVFFGNVDNDKSIQLLNVSYDPTRELFQDLNRQFVSKYERETGQKVTIKQSHGGSSRQAHAVVDGLQADVVSLALPSDIELLRKHGLIGDGWLDRLPHHSQPYTSMIVFVVRKGNPKGIKDWPDLVRADVAVITPNPKTSGNGKLSLLAAWGSIISRGGTEEQAKDYLRRLYQNVPALGTGARDSTTTFTQDKIGDVHLTWENEARFETQDSQGELEIVYPPVTIRADPSVAWVDRNVEQRKTADYAKAYLQFLFSRPAQETMARYGYRPVDPEVLQEYASRLPAVQLFSITLIARDWDDAQQKFFADNGVFDLIYTPRAK